MCHNILNTLIFLLYFKLTVLLFSLLCLYFTEVSFNFCCLFDLRKIEIIQFATKARQQFIRLLALVKWAASDDRVDKFQV